MRRIFEPKKTLLYLKYFKKTFETYNERPVWQHCIDLFMYIYNTFIYSLEQQHFGDQISQKYQVSRSASIFFN